MMKDLTDNYCQFTDWEECVDCCDCPPFSLFKLVEKGAVLYKNITIFEKIDFIITI